jgi:hypothetical protein
MQKTMQKMKTHTASVAPPIADSNGFTDSFLTFDMALMVLSLV